MPGRISWSIPRCWTGSIETAGGASPHGVTPGCISWDHYLGSRKQLGDRVCADSGLGSHLSPITSLGLKPREIAALYFVSITGMACPSIDARLASGGQISISMCNNETATFGRLGFA